MLVGVQVEQAAPPADEQPDRKDDDQQADRRLGAALHGLRQVGPEEDDRQAEREQRNCVARPPGEAEARRHPGGAVAAARDQGRHRREVIRVGGVPEAENGRHGGDDEEGASVREVRDPGVETEHHATLGRARTVIARPRPSTTTALIAGRRRIRPPLKSTRSNARLRADREQADCGHRRREADAEREDQDQPVADSVQRDRSQQDDEGGRARDDPAGDADPEQAPGAQGVVVGVMVIVVAVVVGEQARASATRAAASAGR